jgi:hypothetical protein
VVAVVVVDCPQQQQQHSHLFRAVNTMERMQVDMHVAVFADEGEDVVVVVVVDIVGIVDEIDHNWVVAVDMNVV